MQESRLDGKKHVVKMRASSGSDIEDMYSYISPLPRKKPSHIFLHVGCNDLLGVYAMVARTWLGVYATVAPIAGCLCDGRSHRWVFMRRSLASLGVYATVARMAGCLCDGRSHGCVITWRLPLHNLVFMLKIFLQKIKHNGKERRHLIHSAIKCVQMEIESYLELRSKDEIVP